MKCLSVTILILTLLFPLVSQSQSCNCIATVRELRAEILELQKKIDLLLRENKVSAKPKSFKKSTSIKDMDWGRTPAEQGIKVGDKIRVVGYSANMPDGDSFTIDSMPGAPWTKKVELDRIASVDFAGFNPSVLSSPGVSKHKSYLAVFANQGKSGLGYTLKFEVTGRVYHIGTTFRSYDTGLSKREMPIIILERDTVTFKPLY